MQNGGLLYGEISSAGGVKLKFDEYGIEIPYPQMVIHFDRQREEKAPDAKKDDEA